VKELLSDIGDGIGEVIPNAIAWFLGPIVISGFLHRRSFGNTGSLELGLLLGGIAFFLGITCVIASSIAERRKKARKGQNS